MRIDRLAEGLWRWTAIEPVSGREGNAVYHEHPDGIVLIDPLVPSAAVDAERFWRALDRDVERIGHPPVVAVTVPGRGDGVRAVRQRYAGATAVAAVGDPALAADRVLGDDEALPGGIVAAAADSVALGCACHRLLWTADLLDRPAALAALAAGLAAPGPAVLIPARGEPVVDDPAGWLARRTG